MSHRPPIRHPNPFRPAQEELGHLRSGTSTRPHWQSVLLAAFLILIGLVIVGLHVAGIVGLGMHAGG